MPQVAAHAKGSKGLRRAEEELLGRLGIVVKDQRHVPPQQVPVLLVPQSLRSSRDRQQQGSATGQRIREQGGGAAWPDAALVRALKRRRGAKTQRCHGHQDLPRG